MKKIAIFTSIIVGILVLLGVVNMLSTKQAMESNPYQKEELHPATVKLLTDSNYQNLILPEELDDLLSNKASVTVYFYSPTCSFCKTTTPVVVPIAKKNGIDLKQFNVLEFNQAWDDYQLGGTPTIIHFKDGEEHSRLEGAAEPYEFTEWFNAIKQK